MYREIMTQCHALTPDAGDDDEDDEGDENPRANKRSIQIRLDLGRVSWMDATGSEILGKVLTDLHHHGFSLSICNASPECHMLLCKNHVSDSLFENLASLSQQPT